MLRTPATSAFSPRAPRAARRRAASPFLAGRAALILLQSSLLPACCFHAASAAPSVRIHRPRSVRSAASHFLSLRRLSTSPPASPPSRKMPPLGTAKASGEGLRSAQEWVWYASYGSNMWEDRFLCYIRGGQVEGMSKVCPGCRDPSPPASSTWVQAPHRTWFGRTRTATWGPGGVCFLDPLPSPPEDPHYTLLRLHKITLEQFNDVVAQENSMHFSGTKPAGAQQQPPSASGPAQDSTANSAQVSTASAADLTADELLIPAELIEKLRHPPAGLVQTPETEAAGEAEMSENGAAAADRAWEAEPLPQPHRQAPSAQYGLKRLAWPAFHEVIPGGWYGTVVYLGDLEGWPILTFTSNPEDTRKFYAGKLPVNPPSQSYRKVVTAGLLGSGLDPKETELYIDQRSKPLQSQTMETAT